jgi:hypothetical protein
MIIKLLAIIVLVMITSLSVAGCTTSPTPNVNQTISPPNTTTALQSADLSAKFDNALRSYNLTIVVPFTRAVNQYGNWVYTAAAKDGEEKLVPFVHNLTIEETQNRNDTYTRFNAYVAQAVSNGYKPSTSSSSSSYWQGSKGSDSLYIHIYEPDQGIYGHVMSVPVTGTNYTIYIEQSTPA